MFKEIFKNIKGYTLKSFFSGTDVLLAMGQEVPRVIIVDILMSDFDGLRVIKNIKINEKLKNVYIIAISGDADKKDDALGAGANVFLQKPININTIREVINNSIV